MRRVSVLAVLLLVGALVLAQTPSTAAVSEQFFTGGNATAGWAAFSPAPPGATDNLSIALYVNGSASDDYDDYAGVELNGVTTLPSTAPSFYFRSTVSDAGSGGSPRMQISFGNGGVADLRPLSWIANVWVLIDGGAPAMWDVRGSCPFIYNATYAQVQACEAGSGVSNLIVVSDSGWFHPGGYTHYIDDIKYGNETLSYPSTCIADTSGHHETGLVSAPVHNVVEPVTGPLQPTVHQINCDVMGTLGL